MKALLLRRQNRKGFTLIELMIVVAIIGILAAVAVPMFLNYIRNSKTTEANVNLKAIGEGALSFFGNIKTDTGVVLTAEGTVGSRTNEFPMADNTKTPWIAAGCTTTGNDAAGQTVPNGDNFALSPFVDLKFSINKPHYYKYCVATPADGTTFLAAAGAKLDGGAAIDSEFRVRGAVQDNGQPIMSAVEDVGPAASGIAIP